MYLDLNIDDDDEEGSNKEWYQRCFLEKNQTLPKCSDKTDTRYDNESILQLLKKAKACFDNNDDT